MAKILGIGATCSVGVKGLHPRRLLDGAYPTCTPKQRLSGLLSMRRDNRKLNGRSQSCVVFRHDDFPNQELYCQEGWCRVDREGPIDALFESAKEDQVAHDEMEVQFPSEATGRTEDIVLMRAAGFDVDDDNDPDPENVPVEGEPIDDDPRSWGWNGICYRRIKRLEEHPMNGFLDVEGHTNWECC
ncbi:hypothetical protein IV203_007155 [Nitzschia inconspicua]|uniref:Uncharacterized protein n=1 Tax=Nitzschia inconspicua TaxID=303405 RepID=A0A9K3KFE4_9STRA|nr:hypothetical protein IV203_007155 [Nitzschia inconspicua]